MRDPNQRRSVRGPSYPVPTTAEYIAKVLDRPDKVRVGNVLIRVLITFKTACWDNRNGKGLFVTVVTMQGRGKVLTGEGYNTTV